MPELETQQTSSETGQDSTNGAPLHLQMSQDERILWAREHLGIFRRIAKNHQRKGKPVTSQYVGRIFYGSSPLDTPRAQRISRSLDNAIRKSRRVL